jgi:hypothetical protein
MALKLLEQRLESESDRLVALAAQGAPKATRIQEISHS